MIKRLCGSIFAASVGFGFLLGGNAANAQMLPKTPDMPDVGRPQPDQDERARAAQAAQTYDPAGIPIGSFRLFPAIELDETYNDNIYATPYGVAGQTASFIQVIKPSLELRSDWNNHMLNFYALGSFGIFAGHSNADYQDFSVGAAGRLDIYRDQNAFGAASFNRRHEDPGTPNAALGQTTPTVFNQTIASVGYFQRFNRLSVRLDGELDNFTYFNNGLGPAQGVIPNSDRDRIEFYQLLRLNYEFSPGYEVWTRAAFNQRVYRYVPDSQGFDRDSNGWSVVAGLAIDFGGITSAEIFAGYVQQNYVSFQTLRAPTFGITANWNPLPELRIKPFLRRTVEETSSTTASGYLNTQFGFNVGYYYRENIRFDGLARYNFIDYQTIPTVPAWHDQYLYLSLGMKYLPTPNFFVGPEYQFTNRNSDQPNSNYSQNIIKLRLGAQL